MKRVLDNGIKINNKENRKLILMHCFEEGKIIIKQMQISLKKSRRQRLKNYD